MASVLNNIYQLSRSRDLAMRDDLTKAYNRRFFDSYLDEEIERARRYSARCSIIFLDLDDLKTVNRFRKMFGSAGQAGMGTVSIHTQPKGAQVAVNQHLVEKFSPVDVMLDPGTYVLDITLTGFTPVHKVITVEKGGRFVLDEVLVRQ